jgi:membrane associated rhomboid family serine protease
VSKDESEGAVVSLAQRRAQVKARQAAAERQQAREQTRVAPGEMPKPWVTYVLFGLNLLLWIVMVGAGVDAYKPGNAAMVAWGANFGPLVSDGQWWRLLTAMFVHGDIFHLGFNLYFLWSVGRMCEQIFGRAAYTAVYLASGLLANLVAVVWQPDVISCGASAALFGVFGAFLAFALRRRNMLPEEFVRAVRFNAVLLIGMNLVIGLVVPEISIIAHVAGLLAGFGLGYLILVLAEKPVNTPREANALRMRAVAIASLSSVLVLVVGVLVLPRWENPMPLFERFGARHDELFARYDAAEPAERVAVIEGELLPFVGEAERSLRELELERVPGDLREMVEDQIRYYELRGQAFTLELEGLRNDDEVILAEAENLHAEAIAALD